MATTTKRMLALVLLLTLAFLSAAGCSGLTAREKGALVGGAGGAGVGAALGAIGGNAALGAAVGGPVGLLGGYLLGDKIFQTDPGRRHE